MQSSRASTFTSNEESRASSSSRPGLLSISSSHSVRLLRDAHWDRRVDRSSSDKGAWVTTHLGEGLDSRLFLQSPRCGNRTPDQPTRDSCPVILSISSLGPGPMPTTVSVPGGISVCPASVTRWHTNPAFLALE